MGLQNVHKYGYKAQPGTCLWCGRKLRRPKKAFADGPRGDFIPRKQRTEPLYSKPGDYGDGHFCGLGCGYRFGVAMADNGKRLQPMIEVEA